MVPFSPRSLSSSSSVVEPQKPGQERSKRSRRAPGPEKTSKAAPTRRWPARKSAPRSLGGVPSPRSKGPSLDVRSTLSPHATRKRRPACPKTPTPARDPRFGSENGHPGPLKSQSATRQPRPQARSNPVRAWGVRRTRVRHEAQTWPRTGLLSLPAPPREGDRRTGRDHHRRQRDPPRQRIRHRRRQFRDAALLVEARRPADVAPHARRGETPR